MKKPSLEEAFATLLHNLYNLEGVSAKCGDNEKKIQHAALAAVLTFLWQALGDDKRPLAWPLERLFNALEPRRGRESTAEETFKTALCMVAVQLLKDARTYPSLKTARSEIEKATGGQVTAAQLDKLGSNWKKPNYARLREWYDALYNGNSKPGESAEDKAQRMLTLVQGAFQNPRMRWLIER
jgi:hypothetical protein